MSGDDWGDIFAAAVNGIHRKSPLGIADIVLGSTAWSAKTIGSNNPITETRVPLISGRNALGYSFSNNAPLADIQTAGDQVLQIWNDRVAEATNQYPNLRTVVLIRDMAKFRFKIFEVSTTPYDPADYTWTRNQENNLEGHLGSQTGPHMFTWQPNGSQFRIYRDVSGSARSFQIRKPFPAARGSILRSAGYESNWLTLLGPGIVSIEIVSRPIQGQTYGVGETIAAQVTFNSTVFVTGNPHLHFRIGRHTRNADYNAGSGTRQLVFHYVVVRSDRDNRGVGINPDSVQLNNGSIQDGNNRDAELSHRRVIKNQNHRVLAV